MTNVIEKLNLGHYYTENWKAAGILLSLILSLIMRRIPVFLGIESWYWLYYFPFWLGFEVQLVLVFAIYGWVGIFISMTIDSLIRPGLIVWGPLFIISEMTWITFTVIFILRMNLSNRSDLWDTAFVFVPPTIATGVVDGFFVLVFSDIITLDGLAQLGLGSFGTFLCIFLISTAFSKYPPNSVYKLITPLNTPFSSRPRPSIPSKPVAHKVSKSRPQKPTKKRSPSIKSRPKRKTSRSSRRYRKSISRIKRAKKIQTQRISISKIPKSGDTVTIPKKRNVKIGQYLNGGGEGNIYAISNSLVCKIYTKKRLTVSRKKKLHKMLDKRINIPGVCWPKNLVTYNGKFVGYLMDRVSGWELRTVIQHKQELQKKFPKWTRSSLVELTISILQRIHALQGKNILIGDLNGLNILVKDEKEVYFVDTDSYQVDNIPCPVGTPHFTPPELQGKDYKTIIREPKHEYFSLAVLIFMILLPGKHPYAQQGGTNPMKNIRSGNFSYPLGEWSNQQTPRGPWRFIWSHFPRYLKREFHNVFRNDERLSALEWLQVMKRYKNDLEKGYVTDEIYPKDFKQIEKVSVKCSSCSRIKTTDKTYLESLRKRNENFLCEDCQ